MAPATQEDDPVIASYNIYLTPPQSSQVHLLQYPNRSRKRPYNRRHGALPRELRIKPYSGHLEIDINLNPEHNFNKYRGLKWGDAVRTSKEVQNESATYGIASGFTGVKSAAARRAAGLVKDEGERELDLQNDLANFHGDGAAQEVEQVREKTMHTQTLGGQIIRHDSVSEEGKPIYFIGAFRGEELHLSRLDSTVQMRPQFHHLDAEDQRTRLANSRQPQASHETTNGTTGAGAASSSTAEAPAQPRVVTQSYITTTSNPRGDLEQREHELKNNLQAAHEEPWVPLEFVDEDDEDAYAVWAERMFVGDVAAAGVLRSGMGDEEYLDAVSAPGREGLGRRRRKGKGRKRAEGGEVAEDVDDENH